MELKTEQATHIVPTLTTAEYQQAQIACHDKGWITSENDIGVVRITQLGIAEGKRLDAIRETAPTWTQAQMFIYIGYQLWKNGLVTAV